MIKKIAVFMVLLTIGPMLVSPVEMGIIGGTINKPGESIYGLSAGFGFIVPLLKFEVEYFNMSERAFESLTVGVKLRKKFGHIAPYAIVGAGAEFEKFTLKFGQYDTYLFVGGGIHYFLTSMLSFRGDIRFLNFSDFTRTRLSIGLFFHL